MIIPEEAEVQGAIMDAITEFNTTDQYLLEHDLNERTISHSLAVHLKKWFGPWDVDCEYNRDMNLIKRLSFPRGDINWDDTEAKTVYPDIIIHKRGSRDNIVVIEMKKRGSPCDFDLKKLCFYKEQVGYKFACFIWINTEQGDRRLEEPKFV